MKIRIILFLLLVYSCGIRKTKILDSQKCSDLSYIYTSDQDIRLLGANNIKLYQDLVLNDSKEIPNMQKGFFMRSLFYTFLNNDKNIDSTFKKFKKHPINKNYAKIYLEESTRIWEKRHIIDSENLKRLITFTKKYGYPNTNRFKGKCDNASDMYIVYLHHISNKELSTLINKEHKAGRIPEKDYNWMNKRRKDTNEYMGNK